ncbi:alpha-ketoglutarate dehydrogenase component 4 [Chanos chanos]|uniref:Alpha-ketoglutarate dehydrogenase component 4 n=1 Tax=Chanos chanos TaxID=29144 RepID=A0A6J2VJX0_CHACN|nr:28S ribosomal protein S36, mitochondrial [Chanos chanos]
MGSKMSGKMAAASRVVQVVKPHAPLIKFPNRKDFPKPNVQEVLKMFAASPPQMSPSPTAPSIALPSSPPGPAARLPGTPDTVATVKELPQRYRRRPLALDEMDYIQRGGPE